MATTNNDTILDAIVAQYQARLAAAVTGYARDVKVSRDYGDLTDPSRLNTQLLPALYVSEGLDDLIRYQRDIGSHDYEHNFNVSLHGIIATPPSSSAGSKPSKVLQQFIYWVRQGLQYNERWALPYPKVAHSTILSIEPHILSRVNTPFRDFEMRILVVFDD